MKFLSALFLSLFMVSVCFAQTYTFPKSETSFSINWTTPPFRGDNTFVIKTANGQDLPEKLHVYLWMKDMNHGTADVIIKKLVDGEYEISNIYLIMSGNWDIYFQILKDETVVDEVIAPLTL